MRILTQNCWGPGKNRKKRFKTLAEIIKKKPYDVVCLQEIFLDRWKKDFENNGYHASYEACLTLVGLTKLKGGLITLTKNEPDDVTFHRYKHQGSFLRLGPWSDRILGKGFLEVIIGDTTILNTHNLSTYTEDEIYNLYLSEQITQLLDYVRELKKNKTDIILAGDFNFVKESPLYFPLEHELNDLTKDIKGELPWRGLLKNYKKVDYIFTNSRTPVEANYLIHKGSDHPGIEVLIK